MRNFCFAVIIAVLATIGAPVAHATSPVVLNAADKKLVQQIETYLNKIKTLQAEFLQISSSGDTAKGEILLSRPKRLRIDYAPPTPILIVANGKYLSYVDTELKQVQHLAIEDTPAAFLLRENFAFNDDKVAITSLQSHAGVIRLSVVQRNDPLAGELTLVFTEGPLILKKWSIVDAQGIITDLTLINARFDFPIDDKRFDSDFSDIDLGR